MLAGMTARQFAEWQAFTLIDGPIGEERADLRMGILAAATANVWAKKGKGAKPADFIPQWDPEKRKERQTPEEMLQIVRGLNALFGGSVKDAKA